MGITVYLRPVSIFVMATSTPSRSQPLAKNVFRESGWLREASTRLGVTEFAFLQARVLALRLLSRPGVASGIVGGVRACGIGRWSAAGHVLRCSIAPAMSVQVQRCVQLAAVMSNVGYCMCVLVGRKSHLIKTHPLLGHAGHSNREGQFWRD